MKQSPLKSNKPLKAKTPLKAKAKPKKRQPLVKKPLTELRKIADTWFSKYVRIRDTDQTESGWVGKCITCSKTGVVAYEDEGKIKFNRGWDNGHFVGRDNWVTRYEEENNNLQCSFRCNNMRSGEYVKYKAALRLKYGDDVPEKLEQMAEEQPSHTYKHSREELLQIIEDSKKTISWYEQTS